MTRVERAHRHNTPSIPDGIVERPGVQATTQTPRSLLPGEPVATRRPRDNQAFLRLVTEARLPGVRNRYEDFLPEAEVVSSRRHSPYATWLIYALSSLVIAAVAWMHFSRIDKVITVTGVVRPTGHPLAVDHAEGGHVARVFAKDGDLVAAGQPLIALDDSQVLAEIAKASAALRMLTAEVVRLKAETAEPPTVPMFPLELGTDAAAAQLILWQARQAEIERQRSAADTLIQDARARVATTAKLAPFLGRETASDGEPTDSASASPQESQTELEAAERALAASVARRAAVDHEWRAAALRRLADADAERQRAQGALDLLEERQRRLVLRAPVSGMVIGLGRTHAGATVRVGEPAAMVVAPDQMHRVDIEARVPIDTIDAVAVGQEVTIRVAPNGHAPFTTLRGKITQVGTGAVGRDPSSRSPMDPSSSGHIAVRIAVERGQGQGDRWNGQLVPGMTASIELRAGDYSILDLVSGTVRGTIGGGRLASGG